MKGLLTTAVFWLCVAGSIFAQSSQDEAQLKEQASTWFEDEQFAKAYPVYSQLVSLHPKDADLNFRFGSCALYAGVEKAKAVKHLKFAIDKGCEDPRAYFYLGKAYHLNYDFASAKTAYQNYLDRVSPKEKNPLPAALNMEMCMQGSQLLSNIRDVVVLEKTGASFEDFYRYYDLEEIGGKVISTPEELLSKFDKKAELVSVMHFPGDAVTIYFTSYGKDGSNGKDIYKADILPGGTFSAPERLSDNINTEYDEDFAFLHPDGKTFYFASKGHNSMGGYDIFRSEFDKYTGQFGKAVNLDFAINTPDDDVFYVVDSLKKTAYFASGRSSAQDEVHVYKVMVKSLPVSLTFIAGTYIPEADNIGTKASLKIIDELTGMPVVETTASMGDNGYLLDLPKGGKYRIDVQPEGSAIIHTGVFDVPFGSESAAWAQELKIIEENGQEKLVITNFFDQALDVNIASLSAERLRQKAGLNPNASEDVLKQLEELEDQGIREDLTVDQLTAVAGFNSSTTIETIQVEMSEQADSDEQLSTQLRNHSGTLLQEAASLNELANDQLREAELSMNNASKDDMDVYARTLVAYQDLVLSAEKNRRKASNALEAAVSLHEEADRLQTVAQETRTNLSSLESALTSGELEKAKEVLEGEYIRQANQTEQLLLIQETETLANEKEALEEVQLNELSALRTKEDDLSKSISNVEKQLEAATKKNIRAQLEEELASTNAELLTVQDDIQRKIDQATKLGLEEENLRAQVNLFREAEGNELEGTIPFNREAANSLAQEISATENTIEILTLDDPESLAIVNEEKRATRNDIQILDGIQAQAIASDIELKPVVGLKVDYASQLTGIQTSSISPTEQTRALISTELSKVERQIAFMRSMNVENLKPEEAEQRLQELQLANDWRNELLSEASDIDKTETPLSPSETAERAKQFYPNEATSLSKNAAAGEELTIDAERYAAAFELENQAQDQIQANNAAIITSDDAAEVAALNEENRRLRSIIKWSEAQTTVNNLTVSYENDQRDVIERELNFQDQTENQILLTEAYIEMLESFEQNRGQKMNEDELSELNAKILQSKNRLDGYKADLELALSTEEEPRTQEVELTTLPEALPRNVVALRQSIAPDKTPSEQILIATTEIEQRTAAIDLTDDETEKERLQLEIGLLEELIADANTTIEIEPAPVAQTPETTIDLESQSEKETSAVVELAELVVPVGMVSVNEVNDHPQMKILSDALAGEAQFEKATGQITESLEEIDRLEAELQASTKTGKQKKLDKQIEDQYFEKASAEVKRSMMFSDEAQEIFDSNQEAIDAEVTIENDILQDHIKNELNSAEELMEQAKRVREQAAPEIDDIKQAHEYNRALTLEFEALDKQQRVQTLLAQRNELVQLEDDVLTDVLKGRYEEAPAQESTEEQLVTETTGVNTIENLASEELVTVSSSSEEAEKPEENTDEARVPEDNSAALALVREKVEAEINTIKEPYESIVPTSPKPEAYILRSAEIRDVANLDEDWIENFDLTEAEMTAVRRNEAYVNYVNAREELKELEAKRVSLMDVRNAKAAELNGLLDRISLLEEAILVAENDAERDGLIEELKSVYRDAEVINTELTEADENVNAFDTQMNAKVDQVEQLYVLLDAAEIIAEAKSIVAETEAAVVEAPEEVSTAAPVEETVAEAPSVSPVSPAQGAFTQYLFSYPNVLTGSIFGITDEALYSSAQPIPMNPTLPKGIVYKVQVGAFRNEIPQDHFGKFAPLAGEELNNGITRYTAGLFIAYNSADDAKEQIRDLGYSDAFVVAFKDGKRISLSQAREELGESSEAIASVSNSSVSANETATNNASNEDIVEARNNTTVGTTTVGTTAVNTTPPIPAFANDWKRQTGVYYTVQIGVYSKEVTSEDLSNTPEILADQTTNGFIRYTSGKFTSLEDAEARKLLARDLGVQDAFVSAYVNGKRVSLAQARKEGISVPSTETSVARTYQLKIGSYDDQVPSSVARALLMLEAKWGIYQVKEGNQTVYYTRILDSESESDRAERDFQDFEVEVESVLIK